MPKPWPPHVLRANDLSALADIRHPACTMTVWPRALPEDVAHELRALPIEAYPNVRLITADPARDVLDAFTAAARAANTATPSALVADVIMLTDCYREIMDVRNVLIRLERITEARRRLLHSDEVQMRLLCTYRGLGTRWLANDDVKREGIGKGSNAGIYRKRTDVRKLSPGHIALIKGDVWEGNAGNGLVHGEPYVTRPEHHRMAVIIDDARFAPEYRRESARRKRR